VFLCGDLLVETSSLEDAWRTVTCLCRFRNESATSSGSGRDSELLRRHELGRGTPDQMVRSRPKAHRPSIGSGGLDL
jgi:hypothetical protein